MKTKMLGIGKAGLLFAGVSLLVCSCKTPSVVWLNKPKDTKATYDGRMKYLTPDGVTREIGFREDGVVVWRKAD